MKRTCSTAVALIIAASAAAPVLAQTTWTYNDIDADGNLELSDVEFERYSTDLFTRYDADADSLLSVDEHAAIGMTEPFEAWDAEPDGSLSYAEFNTGLYDTYDADDSLGIDETEYAAYGTGENVGGLDNTVQAGQVINLNDWGYDPLYTDGISVEAMLDADVIDATGEDVGDVENVLFGPGGELVSVIIEVGGFLDIGDTHLNVPWDMVETAGYTASNIVLPFTEEQLDSAGDDYALFNEEYGYGYGDDYGYGYGVEYGEEGFGEAGLDDVANETVVASEQIAEVSGDGAGVVETGPRVWRAPDLIGDYARVRDGDAYMNYGYVEDIVVRDGQIAAVLVAGDRAYGGGYRALPYTGMGYNNWTPGLGYYDLPYNRTEVEAVEPFEDDQLLDY